MNEVEEWRMYPDSRYVYRLPSAFVASFSRLKVVFRPTEMIIITRRENLAI